MVVEQLVSYVLDNVTQLLAQQINLIHGAAEEINSLQRDLGFIQGFLRNSAGNRSDQMKQVVDQIQSAALEAEEVIDEFVYHMEKHKRRSTLSKVGHAGPHWNMKRKVAIEIKGINQKIAKILENRDKFLPSEAATSSEAAAATEAAAILNRRRRDVEEKGVVGLVADASSVIKKLDTPNPSPDAVCIIGMGGLGKTTLAKKIYSSSFVKEEFECRAWVYVSQEYNPHALLGALLDSLSNVEEVDKLREEQLVEKIQVALKIKRYLIVLDDLWYPHQWDGIKRAFLDNQKRSRILITSRNDNVASHVADRTPPDPYFLPILGEAESWELFTQKAFYGQLCPPKLENLAREILATCKGLPLAIVVVAGILANEKEALWPKVAADLRGHLFRASSQCTSILALSYHVLPPHLKPCFLYFGVYPENFEIPVRKLIHLWVAEGFVDAENNTNSDMEDVAELYLSELIHRSLIQVASTRTDGGIKSCRIHDMLRDLAVSEGKLEKFLDLHTNFNRPFDGATKSRRLSIHCGSKELRYTNYPNVSRVRSVLCFGRNETELDKDPFPVFSNSCRYLKVLDLSSFGGYRPPKFKKLILLRYLAGGEIGDEDLPHISKIFNLRTLEAREAILSNSSHCINIWEMKRLVHLYLAHNDGFSFSSPNDKDVIEILPNLRTLSGLHCQEANMEYLKAGRFPNVKKLKLVAGREDCGVFECLTKLQGLQTLSIVMNFRFTNTSLDASAFPNLTKVTLTQTFLCASAFAVLGELPSLQVLKLGPHSLEGSDFQCHTSERHFPQLEVLHMCFLGMGYWKMEGQGLKRLRYIYILRCQDLKAIPNQLKELSTFRQLTVDWCDPAFTEDLKQIWLNDPRLIIE